MGERCELKGLGTELIPCSFQLLAWQIEAEIAITISLLTLTLNIADESAPSSENAQRPDFNRKSLTSQGIAR